MKNVCLGGITITLLFVVATAEAKLTNGTWYGQINELWGVNSNNIFTIDETIMWNITFDDASYTEEIHAPYDPSEIWTEREYDVIDISYDEKLMELIALLDNADQSHSRLVTLTVNDYMSGVWLQIYGDDDYFNFYADYGGYYACIGDMRGMSGGMIEGISLINTGVNFAFLGDVNGDGNVNLADVIVSLQIMTGQQTTIDTNVGADVNNDLRIGIEEAIYSLREVASD